MIYVTFCLVFFFYVVLLMCFFIYGIYKGCNYTKKVINYLALVGKHPDSSRDFNGKYDEQEEEELQKGETKLNTANCVNV